MSDPDMAPPLSSTRSTHMSSRNALEWLRCLDASSHDFHDQLYTRLHGEEYQQCVQILHGEDLVLLVGYLDEVCPHTVIIIPHSPLKSDRLSIVSIPQVPVSGNVYTNLDTYVVPG